MVTFCFEFKLGFSGCCPNGRSSDGVRPGRPLLEARVQPPSQAPQAQAGPGSMSFIPNGHWQMSSHWRGVYWPNCKWVLRSMQPEAITWVYASTQQPASALSASKVNGTRTQTSRRPPRNEPERSFPLWKRPLWNCFKLKLPGFVSGTQGPWKQ